jgi:hypothetical protein
VKISMGIVAVLLSAGGAFAACPAGDRLAYIVSKTCQLPGNFDAAANATRTRAQGYNRPAACASSGPTTPQQRRIRDAFEIASSRFQDHLCDLHSIYYFDGDGHSFGFWEGVDQEDPRDGSRAKFIGINVNRPGANFAQNENTQIGELLDEPGRGPWVGRPSYRGSSFGSNNRNATLLADIAHEMGHVHWHERVKQGANCYDDPLKQSWTNVDKSPRWQPYNEGYPREGHAPNTGGHIPDIKERRAAANDDLRLIYWAGHFPSLLGSATVEEDFVETYRLVVLNRVRRTHSPNLRSLVVARVRGDFDIMTSLVDTGTSLGKKAACITGRQTEGGLELEDQPSLSVTGRR